MCKMSGTISGYKGNSVSVLYVQFHRWNTHRKHQHWISRQISSASTISRHHSAGMRQTVWLWFVWQNRTEASLLCDIRNPFHKGGAHHLRYLLCNILGVVCYAFFFVLPLVRRCHAKWSMWPNDWALSRWLTEHICDPSMGRRVGCRSGGRHMTAVIT